MKVYNISLGLNTGKYTKLLSTFEHRSVTETEYDRMPARTRRPPPSSPLGTEKRIKE